MALAAGTRLGPYEILAPIGAGGMGEVYRAKDTKLGREVAIKTLPPEVADDPERLARFRREAHLLAALNHPNIASIHGLEESDGQPFLVLELVEGDDLAQRLKREEIPVDEALGIGRQIAEALEEAHGKGVIHRDLKPANVKVTPEGKVKVLDFGLAKAYGDDGTLASADDRSQSPTETHGATLAGVILGTAAYMSPEQARGRPLDKRTDIWSFGVLLFEMLSGRGLFRGETVQDTLAAVLERDVDWSRLPPTTPPGASRLLRRCLQRDRGRRLHDIADARIELEEGPAGDEGEGTAEGTGRSSWLPWALTLAMTAVALGIAGLHFTETAERAAPVHFILDTVGETTLDGINSLAVSPDGRYIVLAARAEGGPPQLWLRSLDTPDIRPLPGTEGARQPMWSPDGEWIGFFTDTSLEKVSLSGGAVQRVCLLPPGDSRVRGSSWGEGGVILFGHPGINSRIHTVPATGGEATVLTDLDPSRDESSHLYPRFLPGGQRFLFTVLDSGYKPAVFAASFSAPEERRLILEGVWTRGDAASGHLTYVRRGMLVAQRFDVDGLRFEGEAVPLSPEAASWTGGTGRFSTSANGVVAWLSEATRETQLAWVDRAGALLGTLSDPGRYNQLALSPDGTRVALEVATGEGRREIRVIDVDRGVSSQVNAGGRYENEPVWSPDGRELVFVSFDDFGQQRRIFSARPGEGEPASLLWESDARQTPESWSRSGPGLLYNAGWTRTDRAVWAFPMDGSGDAPSVVLQKGLIIDEPTISPDGRWIAYVAIEGPDLASSQVYVEPHGRPGRSVRASPVGGGQPEWRADSQELFFVAPDRHVMAVAIRDEGDEAVVGPPKELFQIGEYRPGEDRYGVSPDGQRFLVKRPTGTERPSRVHVLLNWPSLLE